MKSFSFQALRQQINEQRKLVYLLLLIGLEVALAHHFLPRSRVQYGFLVKNGDLYVLIWKGEDNAFHSVSYPSLRGAVAFAGTLDLETGRNPSMTDDLERIWMQDRAGSYVMFWKTLKMEYLNQLTFHRRADADFFMRAFQSGSYSTSPFGHSIFLHAAKVD